MSHLDPTITDRGFKHYPSLPSDYGGDVTVYESSNAEGAHVWLYVTCPVDLNNPRGDMKEAVAHLDIEYAWQLSEQLRKLCEEHYQNYRHVPGAWWREDEEGTEPTEDTYGG